MLDKTRPYINPIVEAVAKPFTKLHPNTITLLGFSITLIMAFFVATNRPIVAICMTPLLYLDLLDGTVARMTGKTSAFGGVLDSTVDRLSDVAFILAFAYGNYISWELGSLVAILSLMISYIRSRAELAMEGKQKLAVGIIERPERLLTLSVCLILVVLDIDISYQGITVIEMIFMFLAILSVVTIMQRLHKAYSLLKVA